MEVQELLLWSRSRTKRYYPTPHPPTPKYQDAKISTRTWPLTGVDAQNMSLGLGHEHTCIVVSTAHGETKPGRKTWFYFDLTAVIAPQLFAGLITCVALPSGVDGLPWVFLDGSVPRSGTGTQNTWSFCMSGLACEMRNLLYQVSMAGHSKTSSKLVQDLLATKMDPDVMQQSRPTADSRCNS